MITNFIFKFSFLFINLFFWILCSVTMLLVCNLVDYLQLFLITFYELHICKLFHRCYLKNFENLFYLNYPETSESPIFVFKSHFKNTFKHTLIKWTQNGVQTFQKCFIEHLRYVILCYFANLPDIFMKKMNLFG